MDVFSTQLPYHKLQEVLQEICKVNSETLPNWASLIDTAMTLVESLTQSLCVDVDGRDQLEKLAVQLWNKTVLLKTKGTIQEQTCGKIRYICYQVIAFLNESNGDVASMRKQIMMGLKSTRAWIDMKEFYSAEKILRSLQETIQRLQRTFVELKNVSEPSEDQKKEISDTTKDFFCILCLMAEVKFAQSENAEAMAAVKKAGEIIPNFPSEASNLSMLCYNFGVDCYHAKSFEIGISWLRESCSINKDIVEPNPKAQARTLRLLANCYMHAKCEGWKENALNAVTMANQRYPHVAGMYVRLQLLLESEGSEACLQHELEELMNHPSFDSDLCINVLRLFKNFQRPEVVFKMRHDILHKFEMHQEVGSILVTFLDTFLQASDTSLAHSFSEECITAHNTGQRLEGKSLKQFHIFFWMKAAQYFEKQEYGQALTWYNYSLSLYPSLSVSEPNLAKLQRNLANCYLHLGETTKAAAAIEVAERCDHNDAHTQFIMYRIAIEQEDLEKATSSLKRLVECVEKDLNKTDINIICLVAHTALEQKRTELATIALECLISHSDKEKQVLKALQCLLRLLVDEMEADDGIDKKRLLCHIRTAFNKILRAKDQGKMATAEIEEEATWFMKIAWNLALQCKDDPFCMKEFFNLCIQLLSLCPHNEGNFHRHQNCLIVSCAACLQLAREPQCKLQQQDLLEEVLQHIDEYKQAEQRAQYTLRLPGSVKTSASTEMFLLLYEFEALCKLKDARAENVLDKAFTLPNPSPKLFHTLSVLALDAPANNKWLSARALKTAIKLHLQAEHPDFVKCSADVRNLINMSLSSNEKEAMIYFKETLDMIEKRAKKEYPEMEILWLMTKSWNWGLQYFNCDKAVEAEQWCSLSMSFLKHIPLSREEYQDQMMSVYGEILNRIEAEAKRKAMEE